MKLYLPAALLAAATGVAAAAVGEPSLALVDHYLSDDPPAVESRGGRYRSHLVAGDDDDAQESALSALPPPRRIPTSYESAVLARRILNRSPLGTIATVFPAHAGRLEQPAHSGEARPAGLGGIPIGLPEYVAACEGGDDGGATPETAAAAGNPTLLAIRIATTFKNAKAGSNVSLALQWVPPPPPPRRRSLWPGRRRLQAIFGGGGPGQEDAEAATAAAPSYAALPRFSLIGYLEPIPGQDAPVSSVARCFVRTHPDAKWWLPGNPVHESGWMRLVVTQVYWVGGFGDRAYIGWIPIEEWRNVTRGEWEQVRLPGEHAGPGSLWLDGSEL